MKNVITLLLFVCTVQLNLKAQNIGINATGALPNASAMLDVSATDKGMLVPRMTTVQRTAIAAPATGLLVFDNDTKSFWFYTGAAWTELVTTGGGASNWTLTGSNIYNSNSGNAGIGTTTPVSKLHVKGAADVSQFIIDANSTQSNTNPLIKLRKNDGTDLMWIHSDDITNAFVGLHAGRVNNAAGGGNSNSFVGAQAGYSNSIGSENTAIGFASLFSNSTGVFNTATGSNALHSNTAGNSNTASGFLSLFSNSTGNQNTASGYGSLYANTTAGGNVAIGVSALKDQSFNNGGVAWESNNVAVGNEALSSNQPSSTADGGSNVAIGTFAMRDNITGYANTGVGTASLYRNIDGTFNTALGINSLFNNLSGNSNTAIGSRALQFTTSDNNTAVGASSLRLNSTGAYNTAVGVEALYTNSTGNSNTAFGNASLRSNFNGGGNTAVGEQALKDNFTGNVNTAIGMQALSSNTAGHDNVAMGNTALFFNQTGNYNTAVGSNAGGQVAAAFSNTTCIGNEATATASNQMVLGNANVTQFYCYAAFVGTTAAAPNLTVLNTGQIVRSTSSRRYKKDIEPLEINTTNIYKLNPVSYNSYTDDSRHFGLIAEEVAEVIPELASYSREKDVIKGSTDDKLIPDAVQYPLLSVLLLSEVQKHEQTINELKATITEMKIEMELLKNKK